MLFILNLGLWWPIQQIEETETYYTFVFMFASVIFFQMVIFDKVCAIVPKYNTSIWSLLYANP